MTNHVDQQALIDKRLPGSFTGTPLQDWLSERSVDHVTIVGYMTNVCCDTTARQAIHLGMQATILHDAVGVPTMPDIDGQPTIITYADEADLRAKVGYYLAHDDEREAVAKRAQAHVYTEHTYERRAERLDALLGLA